MQIVPPIRITHAYTQHLVAPPTEVFPLLCPVRERDWVANWEPGIVVSSSGVAERDCVFTMPDDNGESIWYVTRHEPDNFYIEMIRITPGELAIRLDIQLEGEEGQDGSAACQARVRYIYTALGPIGKSVVTQMTCAEFERFMKGWEREMNGYLLNTILRDHARVWV